MQRTNITLPDGLPEMAHAKGINISKVSANAIQELIEKMNTQVKEIETP